MTLIYHKIALGNCRTTRLINNMSISVRIHYKSTGTMLYKTKKLQINRHDGCTGTFRSDMFMLAQVFLVSLTSFDYGSTTQNYRRLNVCQYRYPNKQVKIKKIGKFVLLYVVLYILVGCKVA